MDPRIAANEKTERRHGIPTEHKAVERVHAVLRLGGGMRGLTQKLHVEVDHREHERVDLVSVAGVIHERRVHAFERTAVHEVDLAVPALLGGATNDAHAAADTIERVAKSEECADRRRSHEIVTAAMPDPR